jgi:hypothetical protein
VKDYRNLNDLEDVDTTGIVSGKILKYNGTQWAMADESGGSLTPAAPEYM